MDNYSALQYILIYVLCVSMLGQSSLHGLNVWTSQGFIVTLMLMDGCPQSVRVACELCLVSPSLVWTILFGLHFF